MRRIGVTIIAAMLAAGVFAGSSFTGFMVTPAEARIENVHCDATVARQDPVQPCAPLLRHRGHRRDLLRLKVPTGARGVLSAGIRIETDNGELTTFPQHWRIRL